MLQHVYFAYVFRWYSDIRMLLHENERKEMWMYFALNLFPCIVCIVIAYLSGVLRVLSSLFQTQREKKCALLNDAFALFYFRVILFFFLLLLLLLIVVVSFAAPTSHLL